MLLRNVVSFIIVALSVTGPAAARKCLTGGIYCGRYLLKTGRTLFLSLRPRGHGIQFMAFELTAWERLLTHLTGDYVTRITTHLRASNLTTEDYNIENSLWACIYHGEITFVEMCWFGCVGGTKRDDYCGVRTASAEGDGGLQEGEVPPQATGDDSNLNP
ncbi:hypothetical protein F4803DRAFT_570954 [Xylaria telfairii]|nr:hypothetical protein F4803DRAFT_570954 [Xylaria telfairii]